MEFGRAQVQALVGPAASSRRPGLAECLHVVCAAAPAERANAWLGAALADEALFPAGAAAQRLPMDERRRVHAALCALVAQRPRFKALAVDLAKIANAETSLDAILAYEIAPQ